MEADDRGGCSLLEGNEPGHRAPALGPHHERGCARRSSLRVMRASALICWILVFRSILGTTGNLPNDRTTRAPEEIIAEPSSSRSFRSWMSVSLREQRNDELEEDALPTRHARHRKRRRCRNRSCSHGALGKLLLLRNETTSDPNGNVVSENGERVVIASDPIEDINEGKEDYDALDRNASVVDDLPELMDSYDKRGLLDDLEFQDTELSWPEDSFKANDSDHEATRPTAVYDQPTFHEDLGGLLSRLFQRLRNASAAEDILKELNFVNGASEDPCQKWLNSRDKLEKVFLGGLASLPACPCQYPSNIFYDDKIWDDRQAKHFRWRDVSGGSQRLDVYKPGAAHCVRSLLARGSGNAAAQHCCYDRKRRLLTRGSGAGTPNFVSPEISAVLHERIDVLPWRLCKGDFSRYNGVRPPNNGNGCEANPDDAEYQRQIDDTKYY
ncbi:uncharacterized protein LOC116432569 [Nomia melanderi]|uniref:uncharacterized protein LOC116432569 n=1 Tax=Nomia melanderi TaxID=2448451 RepID=UPI003FCEA352